MEENMTKAYELRKLAADDIFPMCHIISKIGIKEFKSCLETDEVKAAVANATKGENPDMASIGFAVVFDIANVVISHLPDCKADIYLLLSNLSGMDKKEIASLPMATFLEMVVDVIKKEEFKDFFQVVSKFLK